MSARECAMQDIREDLAKRGKCFIAFHSELNSVMRQLVTEQLKAQELCKHDLK